MKGLSLAKFKKIHEDKDWATLIHEDGHKINIAKAPLSHIQRKQLQALALHEMPAYAEGTGDAEPNSESQPSELQGIMNDVNSNAPAPAQPQAAPQTAPQPPLQSQAQTLGQIQNQGLGEEQTGIQNLANAQSSEAKAKAVAYQEALPDILTLPKQSDIIQNYASKDADLEKAFKAQQIDPDHYFQDHSKIAAGIGILLSGFGQGIGLGRAGSNAGLDLLQTGINRDIEAQKANQGQALTTWQMNRQALGNDLAANLATQNQLYTGLQYKLDQAAAQSGSPKAQAEAQINKAKIQQIKDGNNFKLALMSPSSDNPDPATRIQFLVPPAEQAKVADVMNAAKNTVNNAPGIIDAFVQAAQDSRPLTGGLNTSIRGLLPSALGGGKTPGQQALIARLGPTFQDVEGTVRQGAMDNMEHNVSPVGGDGDSTIGTKLNSLIDYTASKSSASLPKTYGIDLSRYPSTNISKQALQNYVAQKYPQYAQYLDRNQGLNVTSNPKIQSGIKYERQILNGKAYRVPVK